MKAVSLAFLLATVSAFAHDSGPTVELKVLPATGVVLAGRPAKLVLRLEDKATHQAVGEADLAVIHERKFHLLAFDAGLTNFRHEHPVYAASQGYWTVEVLFPQPGRYKLWADVARNAAAHDDHHDHGHHHHHGEGAAEETVVTTLEVTGTGVTNPEPKKLALKLTGKDGESLVRLFDTENPKSIELPLSAGGMAMIGIEFGRTDGKAPQVKNYLGAPAHVVITDLKGSALTHVHPMVMDGMLMLHTEFAKAGDYRVFVQWLDGQDLRTAELAVHVESDLE